MKSRKAAAVSLFTLAIAAVGWGAIPRLMALGGTERSASDSVESGQGEGTAGHPQAIFGGAELLPEEQVGSPDRSARSEFSTDFTRATVPFSQIRSGGPPKDGIPAIDEPRFTTIEDAGRWLGERESVFVVDMRRLSRQRKDSGLATGGEDAPEFQLANESVKIYPVQILMWHEIVNDWVGGVPVAVTYCPLCNSGAAFLREVGGEPAEFGVTGRLRFSNMLMYDRLTESWWQQASGRAVAGERAGDRLVFLPLLMIPWQQAREDYPDAPVMDRQTGHRRDYGRNPYAGYDELDNPFLYDGPDFDDEFHVMERVLNVLHNGESIGVPYPVLRDEGVVVKRLGDDPIVIMWEEGTASALQSQRVAEGTDVGTANAFLARHEGQQLAFERRDGAIRDKQSGSAWNAGGRATSGPLAGAQLEPVSTVQHLWFSWTAFEPEL